MNTAVRIHSSQPIVSLFFFSFAALECVVCIPYIKIAKEYEKPRTLFCSRSRKTDEKKLLLHSVRLLIDDVILHSTFQR